MNNSATSGQGAGNGYPGARYAWYMVILLTVAYVCSFIDRFMLGLLIEPIKADLGFTDTQLGLLLGPPLPSSMPPWGCPWAGWRTVTGAAGLSLRA